MANYTIELGTIIASEAGESSPLPFSKIDTAIEKAAPKIFNFYYPFYTTDEKIKKQFEGDFLRNFFTSEIGAETYGRWKLFLQSKLVSIMPKYKKIYEIDSQKYNPFDTTKIKKSGTNGRVKKGNNSSANMKTDTVNSENTQEDSTNNKNTDLYSATPQNGLPAIENQNYLTDARVITDESKQTIKNKFNSLNNSNGQVNNKIDENENGNFTETYEGKDGGATYAEIKQKEYEAIVNINRMIFDELEVLFMGVF